MKRVAVKRIIKELSKLERYEYPTEQSSVFLLPDGNMFGCNVIFSHVKMLEKIVGKKLDVKEYFKHLVKLNMIRLDVDNSILYISINTEIMSKEQIDTLKKIIGTGKHDDYIIDMDGSHTIPYKILPRNSPDWLTLRKAYEILSL